MLKRLAVLARSLGNRLANHIAEVVVLGVLAALAAVIGALRKDAWDLTSLSLTLHVSLMAVTGGVLLCLPIGVSAVQRRLRIAGEPLSVQISVTPATIDIAGFWYSQAVLEAIVTDRRGRPVRRVKVDFFTDLGTLHAREAYEVPGKAYFWSRTDPRGMAYAVLDARLLPATYTPMPGAARVSASVANESSVLTTCWVVATLTGPPASITVAASPTRVNPGESSCITITVKDAIGQNVSDGHEVKLTCHGSGSFPDPQPKTFGGVATTFLLPSVEGTYTVVATVVPKIEVAVPSPHLLPSISAQVTVIAATPVI